MVYRENLLHQIDVWFVIVLSWGRNNCWIIVCITKNIAELINTYF